MIAGGILYVNSGYGAIGGIPGNVLLAFAAGDERCRHRDPVVAFPEGTTCAESSGISWRSRRR